MRRFQIGMAAVVFWAGIIILASAARGGDKPDFSDPDAVLQDIRSKIDACSEAKSRNCMVACGYAMKTLKNFIKANPTGDPSIFQQRWQPCFEAHRDANLPETSATAVPSATPPPPKAKAPVLDRSKFVVAGLQLGGDMNSQKGRFFLLEAQGYHSKTKMEHKDIIFQKGQTRPGPDIIQNYFGTIREAPVYVHFEATEDGTVYMIQFEQKEDMEVEKVEAALLERYGQPTRHQGSYLIWGCESGPEEGLCVKANVSSRSLTIWASDSDIRTAAHKDYRTKVLKAKGTKSGAKF